MKGTDKFVKTIFDGKKTIQFHSLNKKLEKCMTMAKEVAAENRGRIREKAMNIKNAKDILTLLRRILRKKRQCLIFDKKSVKINGKWVSRYTYQIISESSNIK